MIEKLEAKLKVANSSSNSQTPASTPGNSQPLPYPPPEPSATNQCLHRLYISLGDVTRYEAGIDKSPDYSEAADAYEKSEGHLPGSGNSFNQVRMDEERSDELRRRV